MSGIAGLLFLDGRPVESTDLSGMVEPLRRRGPDGTAVWHKGPVGLGHTALMTTPEAHLESQPASCAEGQLVITADARVDNRDELILGLGLGGAEATILGDAELILKAYEKWGEECPEKLLGDFAFAIWDGREQRLFCARDHFGVRPFNYHHAPGRLFAWASEVRAILTLEQVPHRVNEGRIADFLVTQLEGIDKTSTFFQDVLRLPPAHTLTVTPGGFRIRRYWELRAGPEMSLESDDAYDEAFLHVFSEAIRCRLRGADTVGSMLSGGMDSGSIVAVARQLRADAGEGPLPTFSAVGPDPESCTETRMVHAALAMEGLDPHCVCHSMIEELLPDLEDLTWKLEEPFDGHMTLLRAVYFDANRNGIKAVMDGIDGDNVLSHGSHIARLIRMGRLTEAWRNASGLSRFWSGAIPTGSTLLRGVWRAMAPEPAKKFYRRLRSRNVEARVARNIESSIIDPDFARRVRLGERLRAMDGLSKTANADTLGEERAGLLMQPFLTVALERYNRTASMVAVEPRTPFLDLRVVDLCLALPGEQKLNNGWPKFILRRAMAGRLPDTIRWRQGKEHLGWEFTLALMGVMQRTQTLSGSDLARVSGYVDAKKLNSFARSWYNQGEPVRGESLNEAVHLANWLEVNLTPSGLNEDCESVSLSELRREVP